MQNILDLLNSHGLYPDSLIQDDQIHRFKVGDSSSKPGWYVYYKSGICVFGNFKTGLKETYKPSSTTDVEEKTVIADAQKQFNKQKEIDQFDVAKTLTNQWLTESWDFENPFLNPYFVSKKLTHIPNIRFKDNVIYVPLYQPNSDMVWSYQRIYPTGEKKFTSGGKAKGGFFIIDGSSEVIYLCEGLATGITVYMASKAKVICCFSANGIVEVARHLPKGKYIIAADDDQFTSENAGRKAAVKAGELLNAPVVYPKFKSLDTKPTDFNDLLCLEGIDTVMDQLAIKEAVKLTDDYDGSKFPLAKSTLENILPHWKWSKETKNNPSEPVYPLATIDNLRSLLNHLGIILRYNVISKQEEILIPGASFSIDNEAVACLAHIKSIQSQISMPTANVGEYITNLSEINQYNPVTAWVTSRPWDGISRLNDFYSTLTAANESDGDVKQIKETLIKRWLVSAVAAAFSPRGISAHGVLVLQGDQYIGKTAWLKSLAPKELDIIADGKILKPDDKDSVNQAIRYWIVELGELDATFRKADMAQLKAFLTKDSDLLRRAFAPKDSRFARRTVFFASVNPKQFLHDSTGNRRFWTIECKKINYDHGLDMQQIWAEVYNLYRLGEPWVLNYDEMALLNSHNEAFLERDHVEELLAKNLDWDAAEGSWKYMTSTEALKLIGIDAPRHVEKSKATQTILRLNGSRKRLRRGYVELFVPPDIVPVAKDNPNSTTPLWVPPRTPPRNFANDI